MKKILLTSLFAFCSSVFAFEWGGLLSAEEKFTATDFTDSKSRDLTTTAEASLWLKVPFSEDGMNYLATEGKYNFEYDYKNSEGEISNYVDLSLLKLALNKQFDNSSLSFSLGRFFVSDLSSIVFSQNADGLLVKYEQDKFTFSIYGAYTGLLNGKSITMLSANDEDSYVKDKDSIYDLAEKFAIGSVSVNIPNLFVNQTLALEGLGAVRLEENSFNRFYATLSLTGPIFRNIFENFFYNASTTIGFSKYDSDDSKIANLSQLNATYYSDKNATVGIGATFASEDFTGFTSQTAVDSRLESQYSGFFKVGLFGSIKPTDVFLISANADAIYDSQNDEEKMDFSGFQAKANLSFQVFTDLSLNASVTQFFDTRSDNFDNNKSTFVVKAIFNF